MLNIGSWEADAVGYWARRHHGEVGGSVGIPSTQWVFTLCLLALLLCYFVCLNSRVSDVFVLWFSQPFSLSVNQNTFVLLQTNQRCACFFLLCENNASKCCIFNVSSSSFHFLRATAVPADTAKRLSAMAILSVCPSICPSIMTRYRFKPRWDRDSGFSPYDSLEFLVSYEVIWCRWVRRFPSNDGIKVGYPLRNCNFTTIGSSSMRTVLRLNCAKTIQDRPGQPAYVMFGIKRRLRRCKVWPPMFKESSVWVHQIWVPPWKCTISATVD